MKEEEDDYTFGLAYIFCLLGVIVTLLVTHIGYPWWFAIVLILSPVILYYVVWILCALGVIIWTAIDHVYWCVIDYFQKDENENDENKLS